MMATNDRRFPGISLLPGGIVTEYVFYRWPARSARPPERWLPGSSWIQPGAFFAGSPQSLVADYLLEGATGGSGHVYEPYLVMTPRPDLLLPAYYHGPISPKVTISRFPPPQLANIVVGDPYARSESPRTKVPLAERLNFRRSSFTELHMIGGFQAAGAGPASIACDALVPPPAAAIAATRSADGCPASIVKMPLDDGAAAVSPSGEQDRSRR